MLRALLLPVVLLLVACAGGGPAPDGSESGDPPLPPNTILVTQRPVSRPPAGKADAARGTATRLEFPGFGDVVCSAPWGRPGAPDPYPLDPAREYRFLVTWLGWHFDMSQVVEIRTPEGGFLWRNPEAWINPRRSDRGGAFVTSSQRVAWWEAERKRGLAKTFWERVFLLAIWILVFQFAMGRPAIAAAIVALVGGLTACAVWWPFARRELRRASTSGAPPGPGDRVLRRERRWIDSWAKTRARGRARFLLHFVLIGTPVLAVYVVGCLALFEPARLRADPVRLALVPALFAPLQCLLGAAILWGIGERRYLALTAPAG